jgi:hypothetical protein
MAISGGNEGRYHIGVQEMDLFITSCGMLTTVTKIYSSGLATWTIITLLNSWMI